MPNVVIIGAGYSGILTAQELSKKLRGRNDIKIILIDKKPYHTVKAELIAAAAGRIKPESIKIPLSEIFADTKVRVVTDYVTETDFNNKRVHTATGSFRYDYLVFAAGSKPSFCGIHGAERFSYQLFEYEDAVHLRNHVSDMFRQAAYEKKAATRKAMLTFIIAGFGSAGIEIAGELTEVIPILCTKYNIPYREVMIKAIDVLPCSLPDMSKRVFKKVESILRSRGVTFEMGAKIREVTNSSVIFEKAGVLHELPSYTVIWTAGVTGCEIAEKAAKVLRSESRSRLKSNAYLMSVTDRSVFVTGDDLFYKTRTYKDSVPQMIKNCEASAKKAADNISALINGKRPTRYKPSFHGTMISIGSLRGISYVGFDRFGPKAILPSVPTQFAKRAVNVAYLSKVLGKKMIPKLIKNEFFSLRVL